MTGPDLFSLLDEAANRGANRENAMRLRWLRHLRLLVRRGPAGLDLDTAMAGATRADHGTDDWWRSTALAAIRHLAQTGRDFTAADIRDLGVTEPDQPNRWGGVFLRASRAGLIECVGAERSTRGPRNGSLTRVWRGVR